MKTLAAGIGVAAGLVLWAAGPSPAAPAQGASGSRPLAVELGIDAAKSRFIVETQTSGLSASSLHDHRIEIADFSGTIRFVPGTLATGALSLTVRAGSLHLLDDDKVGEGRAIEWTLREDVLEVSKFPEITFKTRFTKSSRRGDGTYDVRLTGDLVLHGVRKVVTIPARVSLDGGTLRAIGAFELRQSDFDITPFSFVGGVVTVKDAVVLSFDIVGRAL